MQIPGGGGIRDNIIRHNNFDLNVTTTTSCIMMSDAINITIENNRLHGGSYIIYFEGNTTGCQVTGNLFLAPTFGYIAGRATNQQTYRGNIFGARAKS